MSRPIRTVASETNQNKNSGHPKRFNIAILYDKEVCYVVHMDGIFIPICNLQVHSVKQGPFHTCDGPNFQIRRFIKIDHEF